MRDSLEERLADRLGALGDTVDDELPPPVDLELQVSRRRRNARAARRWSVLGVAAVLVAALTTVAVVHGTTGRSGTMRVETSSTTAVPVHDSLQPGTVMLSARGRFVVSLDATGTRNATMVAADHGDILYARATDDHRALWYLSLKKGSKSCGDVVRADIDGRSSTIVTHAVSFDVSPDGSRLALYGAGDLARDECVPVHKPEDGRVVVLDLASHASSAVAVRNVKSVRWAPDGSYLVAVSCGGTCESFKKIGVPRELGQPLTVAPGIVLYPTHDIDSASLVFGPDGLYALEFRTPLPRGSAKTTDEVSRVDPASFFARTPLVFSGGTRWDVSQVIPTTVGTYVVAAPAETTRTGLYRIEAGELTLVRLLPDAGTLTPVAPIP